MLIDKIRKNVQEIDDYGVFQHIRISKAEYKEMAQALISVDDDINTLERLHAPNNEYSQGLLDGLSIIRKAMESTEQE